jgi:hypothetical protein
VRKGEGSEEGGREEEGRTGWRVCWETWCVAATIVAMEPMDKCG